MNDTALLDELAQLAAQRIGLRIPDDAHDRFTEILREHAKRRGYSALEGYRNFLADRQADGEWEELARAFTSGETFFFRDHGQFDLLRLRLLPELIAQHRNDKTLRLWSAGCASGEEAYSLAMLVDMLLPEQDGWDILILGTDIDSEAIAKAQRGRYGQWSFRMIPPEMQQRYFHTESAIRNPQSAFILDERIRRMVTFRVSNLVGEPFPDSALELHDMDLILCRNVFIYFVAAAVTAVAAKLAATLRSGGYLLTAHTELIGHPMQELKSRLLAEGVVYQRVSCHSVAAPLVPPPPINIVPVTWQAPVTRSSVSVDTKTPATAQATPPASPAPVPATRNDGMLFEEARAHAERGEFDLAEQVCREVLAVNPLAASPYFLLAQLAQVKGDLELAKECLNKAIYLNSHFVAAYLEQAALYERSGDLPRAQTLRRAALGIVRAMSNDKVIEQYETTAGELAQWLTQWEREATEG
ncbi:MAG: CheR family methyltransferase [Gallionella sp.]|nr:CheR family methyltransferase [Gallionella sp.]